jgi:hypothetical protein
VTVTADDATEPAEPAPPDDEAVPTVSTTTDGDRGREAWRWASLFVAAYLLIGVGWVFSNPPGAAPDEPDHLVKAIGMGRFDIGDEYDEPLPDEPVLVRRNLSITRIIDIPAGLAPDGYTCYAFDSDITAACLPDAAPDATGTVERQTPIGAYPPFAYVPMGVAARAMSTPYEAFLAARLVALATAAAALFVGAWFLVRELGRPALLGAFVALTPMSVFAASSVTTSGLEIAGGFSLGALVVVCLRKPEALTRPRTQLAIAGVGTGLVLSRQMGVVTLGILLAVLAAVSWRQVWQLVREHRLPFVASVGLLATSTVAVGLWERAYDHPVNTGSPATPAALDSFVDNSENLIESAVGVFGWLDSPLPIWVVWAWLAVTITVCGMALVVGNRRERLVLSAVLVATVGVTYAAYASVFYPVGAASQGRHLLPLFAFCPTFAGVVLFDRLRSADLGDALRRLFVAVGVVAGAAQFLSLYFNAQRYAVGIDGPLVFFGDAEWSPTFGWAPWLLAGFAGAVLLAAVAISSRPQPTEPITPGES